MESKDFVDYAGFYLALASVDEILMSPPGDEEPLANVDLVGLQEHRSKGAALLKLLAPSMDDGISVLLAQMTEKSRLRVKTLMDRAVMGNPLNAYFKRAEAVRQVFIKLMPHQGTVRDVMGAASTKAIPMMKAAGVSSPANRILAVASIPTANAQNARLKKWAMVASGLCGNPINPEDQLANDMAEATALTKESIRTQAILNATDPGDANLEALSDKKAKLEAATQKAIAQSVNPAAVMAITAQQKADDAQKSSLTIVGQKIEGGLTPDKEECVMARGPVVIAAGAGSGKTRVLAAKVIYHLQELNLNPSNILAVSFSRKSAAELRHRIIKFGGEAGVPLTEHDLSTVGTTHSIARMVLNASGVRVSGNPNADENEKPIEGEIMNGLLRAAVAQVKMRGNNASIPRDAMTFFPNLGKANFDFLQPLTKVKQPINQPSVPAPALSSYLSDAAGFERLIRTTITALEAGANSLEVLNRKVTIKATGVKKTIVMVAGPGLEQFGNLVKSYKFNGYWGNFKRADSHEKFDRCEWWLLGWDNDIGKFEDGIFEITGINKIRNSLLAIKGMGKDPSKLSESQKALLQNIVTQPIVSQALNANDVPVMKLAAKSLSDLDDMRSERDANYSGSDFHFYMNNPANMWFNIGATDEDFMVSDKKDKKKKVGNGVFKRYIGINKNNLVAPGDLFTQSGGIESFVSDDADEDELGSSLRPQILSAVYGAYEWLKANAPKVRGRMDYDDQLIQAVRKLTEKPDLLRSLQMQFRCVLVDEAQDLNIVQHHLFGLLAGYTDPSTLTPRKKGPDGRVGLTADTFAFIGDDKQAIYEFRGADPDKFIEKSDAFKIKDSEGSEKSGDFKTMLLEKNFRSGKAIVDAANRLIAHNSKQIPMVCTTDPKKGEGSILRKRIGFEDEGPRVVVNRILGDLETLKDSEETIPKDFYKKYGLAVRTNRELFQYQMELIGEGIPFQSKRDPFSGPALRPIVSLFKMFMPNSTVDVRNRGFIAGLYAPALGLKGDTVSGNLDREKAGDYYEFCKKGGYEKVYKFGRFRETLKTYCTKTLPEIEDLVTSGKSDEVLDYITSRKGADGQTFIDQLALSVRNDPEGMEDAQNLADQDDGDGRITDDILRAVASAPLTPLYKLSNKYPNAKDFVAYLDSLATKSLQNNKTDAAAKPNDNLVVLDTVHGWKGLECEHLFVPMFEGRFPIIRQDAEDRQRALESERRLAYVALTRGMSSVTIIEPTMKEAGEKSREIKPSQFMAEACIQVSGSGPQGEDEGKKGKTASSLLIDRALKTGDYSAFMMPVLDQPEDVGATDYSLETMWDNLDGEQDAEGDYGLIAQWGEVSDNGEEN